MCLSCPGCLGARCMLRRTMLPASARAHRPLVTSSATASSLHTRGSQHLACPRGSLLVHGRTPSCGTTHMYACASSAYSWYHGTNRLAAHHSAVQRHVAGTEETHFATCYPNRGDQQPMRATAAAAVHASTVYCLHSPAAASCFNCTMPAQPCLDNAQALLAMSLQAALPAGDWAAMLCRSHQLLVPD